MKKKLLILFLVCAMLFSMAIVANAGNDVDGAAAVDATNNNAVVINVRTPENFAKGHLKGALSLPVFTAEGPVSNTEDALAKAFTDYVNANSETFNKTIYIVCNSGARGAQATTVLRLNTNLSS